MKNTTTELRQHILQSQDIFITLFVFYTFNLMIFSIFELNCIICGYSEILNWSFIN